MKRKCIKNIKISRISNLFLLTFISSVISFLISSIVFSAPPTSPYYPGETLNPNCSPGDPNCTVSPPLPTYISTTTIVQLNNNLLSFNTGTVKILGEFQVATGNEVVLYIGNNGNVGIGTTNLNFGKLIIGKNSLISQSIFGIPAGSVSVGIFSYDSNPPSTPLMTSILGTIKEINATSTGSTRIGVAGLLAKDDESDYYLAGTLADQDGTYNTAKGVVGWVKSCPQGYTCYSGLFGGDSPDYPFMVANGGAIININTTTPAYFPLVVTTNYSNPLLAVNASGNVGIGNIYPYFTLDVFTNTDWGGMRVQGNDNVQLIVEAPQGRVPLYNFVQGGISRFVQFVSNDGSYYAIVRSDDNGNSLDSPFVILRSSGNIGIGITTPQTRLHISGTTTAWNILPEVDNLYSLGAPNFRWANIYAVTTTIGGTIAIGSDTIEGSSTTTLFTTGNSNQLVLGANGNIGIGTTEPGYKLDVAGALRLQPSSVPTGANGVIYYDSTENKFKCFENGAWTNCIGAGGGGYWAASGNHIYNTNTGNVGIGTTTPGAKLDIPVNLSAPALRLGPGGDDGRIWTEYKNYGPAIIMYDYDDVGGGIYFRESPTTDNENNPEYEAFIIGRRGNIGIGTTTPGAKLHIIGNQIIRKEGNALQLFHDTNGGWVGQFFHSRSNEGSDRGFIVFQDDSAQIPGSAAERGRLTIGVYDDFGLPGSARDELWLQGGSRLVFNTGSWDSELNSIIGSPNVYGPVDGYQFRVNNTSQVVITGDGNVGIGTTAPSSKLEIASVSDLWGIGLGTDGNKHFLIGRGNNLAERRMTLHIPNFLQYGGTGAQPTLDIVSSGDVLLFRTEADTGNTYIRGNVGIGTTNPVYKLDVQGSIRQTNATNCTLSADAAGVIICSPSSQKYKNVLGLANIDTEKFLSLSVKKWTWNEEELKKIGISLSGETIGFVAEEVSLTMPELVRYDSNNQLVGIKTELLPFYLFETIKNLVNIFTEKVKSSLASLGVIIENGILKVKEIFTEKLIAEYVIVKSLETERVKTNAIEMIDKATHEIYCVWLENGEFQKAKGSCDEQNLGSNSNNSTSSGTQNEGNADNSNSNQTGSDNSNQIQDLNNDSNNSLDGPPSYSNDSGQNNGENNLTNNNPDEQRNNQ